jgi:hypothetical protein
MATRLFTIPAVISAVALLAVGGAGGRPTETPAPTIYFVYAMNCTFSIVDDAGRPVTSIAPGSYQVDVRTPLAFGTLPRPAGTATTDMTACKGLPQFQLSGPGVSLFTTLSAGCEDDHVYTETLQASATYVAQDLNQPSVAHGSFTTLASGTPTAPTTTYGGGPGKLETSQDIVGSGTTRGTLNATVAANGSALVTSGGKAVSHLRAGKYKLTVDDRDAKAGFVLLGPKSTTPLKVTGAAFRGKHRATLALTAGRWTYYATLGTVRYFRVG